MLFKLHTIPFTMPTTTSSISAHPRRIHKTSEFLGIILCLFSFVLEKYSLFEFTPNRAVGFPINIGRAAGCLLIVSSAFIIKQTQKELAKYDQPHEPGKPTTRLITTGPFRYSRNPTYSAIVLLFQPGLALVLGNIWMVFLLPLSFLLFWYVLIREEEEYLQQKFKENWKGYCKSARRWI